MEKQITIWEWLEMLKEEGQEELSRVITLENTFTTLETIRFGKQQMFILNDFTIWADTMEIEVQFCDVSKCDRVVFRLFLDENYVLSKVLYSTEFIRIQKYADYSVEIIRGVL